MPDINLEILKQNKYSKYKKGKGNIIKKCLWCNENFRSFKSYNRKFCSNQCSSNWKTRKHRIEKRCLSCGKLFNTTLYINKLFCSWKCYDNSRNFRIITCVVCGDKKRYREHAFKIGNPKYCSHKCSGVYLSQKYMGENNPQYKDGKSKERQLERDNYRATIEYKNFLRAVFAKFGRKCSICGELRNKKKDNLVVHHKKRWVDCPELRFEPTNGIVVCKKCHFALHRKNKCQI